ncbi:aldehyde dehydrogenase family protein, partial [Burkholderia thailandensis]|uniref:aldehyde dehydrogenase family protein n=1 Tax=Burkholderia thailandensis TaxID=57975 RepID=UPI0011AEE178
MNLAALSTQHQRQSGFLARRQFGNWIDGAAAEPRSGRYLPVVDPATEMTIAEVAASDARDVDAAVAAARRAFDSGDWPRMRPASREKLLHRLPDRV